MDEAVTKDFSTFTTKVLAICSNEETVSLDCETNTCQGRVQVFITISSLIFRATYGYLVCYGVFSCAAVDLTGSLEGLEAKQIFISFISCEENIVLYEICSKEEEKICKKDKTDFSVNLL